VKTKRSQISSIFIFFILILITCSNADSLKPVRLDDISEAWLKGDLDNCYTKLQSIYQANRDSLVIVYNLGYINYLQGRETQALSFFEKAKKIDPSYHSVHLVISKIYEHQNKLADATDIIVEALKTDQENYDLQMRLASLYQKTGKIDEAIQKYTAIIEEYEDSLEPQIELVKLYRKQKNFFYASKILKQNLDEIPEREYLLEKYKFFRDIKDSKSAKNALLNLCSFYPFSEDIKKYQDSLRINYESNFYPENTDAPKYNFKFDSNEKLNYLVEYGFIKLGWLKVRVENELMINGRKVYQVVFYVDSNPNFDFIISLHHIYESFIDAENLNAVQSRLYTPDGEDNLVRMYYFHYEINKFLCYAIKPDGRYTFITKDLPNATQDGTSMLFWARGLVSNKTDGKSVVVINEEFKYAVIDFLNKREKVEVVDKDVNSEKIFAQAKFTGIAGMNGDAFGWFSMDNQAVPLQGKIKIFVGSITVSVDGGDD